MNVKNLYYTIIHLRPNQVIYQVLYRLHKPEYRTCIAPRMNNACRLQRPIEKPQALVGREFKFLNLTSEFHGWNYTGHGMLWAYNLNYMDWLGQEGLTEEVGCKWIDCFIDELPTNKIGLDPYPIALRSINWCKFFWKYPLSATTNRLNSLYSQVRLLGRKLEFHLLGNHLLEDYYALFIGAVFFQDERMFKTYSHRLLEELEEQVLPDGAHYEQSPMYHCILLDRLLDCCNFSFHNQTFKEQEMVNQQLLLIAQKMLGHLKSITYADGSIPMLNDSAMGIAPSPKQLLDYASRLGIDSSAREMKECGYRKMTSRRMEVIVDVGNVTATYQPGHTHADSLNYELKIDGKPFVVDTGISTYNKTARRQYERSTQAHNTVTVDGQDSSEVWGGFRVGRRAKVKLLDEHTNELQAVCTTASGIRHQRHFSLEEDVFSIKDNVDKEAVSRIHLAPSAEVLEQKRHNDTIQIITSEGIIEIQGALDVAIVPCQISQEYNRFLDTQCIEMKFKGLLKYTIQ